MIFNNMNSNICEKRWLMYPRFVQLFINSQHKDLEKIEYDKMELEHMNNIMLEHLNSYKNKKEKDIAPFRRLFANLKHD
ncbi:hypothetical protein Hanom_Chr07g00626661 [Helianthus anomalus]